MRSISSSSALFSVLIDSTALLSERVGVVSFSGVENKFRSELVLSVIGIEVDFFSISETVVTILSDLGKLPFPFKNQYYLLSAPLRY